MKIRTTFVSNSSSSSYVVDYFVKPKIINSYGANIDEILKKLNKDYNQYYIYDKNEDYYIQDNQQIINDRILGRIRKIIIHLSCFS